MNVSRSFMLVGIVFLLIGIPFGIYMGATNNFDFAPLHAHLNLLGFVLMTVFGIVYRLFPDMAASSLAKIHFWLHAIGAAVLLVMLFMLLSGRISEAGMVPVAPIAEFAILIGIICFAWNLLQNGK
jgi:bacteriorhodopsin